MLAWGALREQAASDEEFARWTSQAKFENTAVLAGPPSGNLIVIDGDVGPRSAIVRRLAEDVFGSAEHWRVGREPRWMLCYRLPSAATFTKRVIRLAEVEEGDEHESVEIIARDHAVTIDGIHWAGRRFEHSNLNLFEVDRLRVITEQQVDLFERRLALEVGLDATRSEGVAVDASIPPKLVGDVLVPTLAERPDLWRRNPATGRICDGREKWLTQMTFAVVRYNPAGEYTDADIKKLRSAVIAAWHETTEAEDRGREWSGNVLVKTVSAKLRVVARRLLAGKVTPARRAQTTEIKRLPAEVVATSNDGLDWITKAAFDSDASATTRQVTTEPGETEETVNRATPRRRIRDVKVRKRIASMATARIREIAIAVFEAVVRGDDKRALDIVKANPGVGKSTTFLQTLCELCQERGHLLKGQRIVFAVPNYDNAVDLLRKVKDWNYEVRAVAAPAGLETAMPDFRSAPGPVERGIAVGLWIGRSKAPCPVRALHDAIALAGVDSSALCTQTKAARSGLQVVASQDVKPIECALKAGCAYYLQPALLEPCSIVICVRSYLSIDGTPAFLTDNCALLVVDEDPTLSAVKVYAAKREHLLGTRDGRVTPRMKKRHRVIDSNRVQDLRETLWQIVTQSMEAQQSKRPGAAEPARALIDWRCPQTGLTGDALLDAAAACLERDDELKRAIRPYQGGDVDNFIKTVSAPLDGHQKAEGLAAERALIRVLRNRMARLRADDIALPGEPRCAHGVKDARLQLRFKTRDGWWTHIRISERLSTNWADTPIVILDASAQKALVDKLFARDARMHEIPSLPNLKIALCLDALFSNAAFNTEPGDDKDAGRKAETARRNIQKMRDVITKVAFRFRGQRVLVVTTIDIEKALFNEAWAWPSNIDFWHFGALRGLDGARQHAALITIGRSQLPVEAADALAAAFGHDDADGYDPVDACGDGMDVKGGRLFRERTTRRLLMRNGRTLIRTIEQMQTERGRQVDLAWTCEEIRQAAGRLRDIHRIQAPLWVCFGTELHEDAVVDRLFNVRAMLSDAAEAERARTKGEIDAPGTEALNRGVDPFEQRLAREALVRSATARYPMVARIDDAIAMYELAFQREENWPAATRTVAGYMYVIDNPLADQDMARTIDGISGVDKDLAERGMAAWRRAASG
ncbi:hypothetical protein IHQ68_04790 [Chelatococcus sambhunathii]|uniref:Bifunctional DNA primase/polymerase, N-terminal n=1 Tax=Chelatococcus sambhunathii TaxID=363953 RepID=A0ABU1DCV5_9HYPH|nr:hypothetical protein [Chelatococcus sambhunathii]MDR4305941.1 hypothetical protein [Chelatococcus sambhunathii]